MVEADMEQDLRCYARRTAIAVTEAAGCARHGQAAKPLRVELLAPVATDEAEIRDALRRAPAGGATIVVAAGRYELRTPLVVGGKHLTLYCERGGTAVLEYVGGPVLECRDCVVRLERVELVAWSRKFRRLRHGFSRSPRAAPC